MAIFNCPQCNKELNVDVSMCPFCRVSIENIWDEKIQNLYRQYQEEYNCSLPEQEIKYVDSDKFLARYLSEELYDKKYILYVNKELYGETWLFITQILYHEFTHLADSLRFLEKPCSDFKNIMKSYSEFHASEVEMVERIHQTKETSITMQTDIKYVNTLSINEFMKDVYNFMIKDLVKMTENISVKNFYFNTNHIYYFYGYVNALKKFGINYSIQLYRIPAPFVTSVMKIQHSLLSEEVRIEEITTCFLSFIKVCQEQMIMNQIRKKF